MLTWLSEVLPEIKLWEFFYSEWGVFLSLSISSFRKKKVSGSKGLDHRGTAPSGPSALWLRHARRRLSWGAGPAGVRRLWHGSAPGARSGPSAGVGAVRGLSPPSGIRPARVLSHAPGGV